MKAKKLLLNAVPLLFVGGIMSYAAAPTGGYLPNATLDPDCFVQIAVDADPWFGTDDNAVATDNTEYIYTMGRVGIGTDSPAWPLEVRTGTGVNSVIDLDSPIGFESQVLFSEDDVRKYKIGYQPTTDKAIFYSYENSLMNMVIEGTGNVGIGTSTPNYEGGNTSSKYLTIATSENSNPNNSARLELVNTREKVSLAAGQQTGRVAFNTSNNGNGAAQIVTGAITGILEGTDSGNGLGGTLNFYTKEDSATSTGGAKMRILGNGNVGIGTTTPAVDLHIRRGAGETTDVFIQNTGNASGDYSSINLLSAGGYAAIRRYSSGFSNPGLVSFFNLSGDIDINSGTDDVLLNVTGAGKVGIGTTTPNHKLEVNGGAEFARNGGKTNGFYTNGTADTDGVGIATQGSQFSYLAIQRSIDTAPGLYISKAAGSVGPLADFWIGGTMVGRISTDGTTTTYGTTSDKRLKENFASVEAAVDTVNEIEVSNYNFIGSDVSMDGFIAQQLETILPYAVIGTETDVDEQGNMSPMMVDYSKVVPVLTAAIQELSAQNAELSARLAEVEAAQ